MLCLLQQELSERIQSLESLRESFESFWIVSNSRRAFKFSQGLWPYLPLLLLPPPPPSFLAAAPKGSMTYAFTRGIFSFSSYSFFFFFFFFSVPPLNLNPILKA